MAFTLHLYRPRPFVRRYTIHGHDGQFVVPRVCVPNSGPSRAARIDPDEISRWSRALRKIFSRAALRGKTAYLFRGCESRFQGNCISRSSQWPRGRNVVTIAHDFSSRSLAVTSEGRIYVACNVRHWKPHSCPAFVCSYRDRECRTFSRCGTTLPRTDRQLYGMSTSLESWHATFAKRNESRDRVCTTRFSASTSVSSRKTNVTRTVGEGNVQTLFLFFDTVASTRDSRCRNSTTVVARREIGISVPQRIYLWSFTTGTKRASCHSANIDSQFRSVCAFTIDRLLYGLMCIHGACTFPPLFVSD